MADFYKIVRRVDQITDCVPIVNTVKNIGILLYQLIHKVNRVANPVRPSWKEDVKVYALSKKAVVAAAMSLPIYGNILGLLRPLGSLAMSKGGTPMEDVLRKQFYGYRKHGCEIAGHYLARNPDLKLEESQELLDKANAVKDHALFELILNSREDWLIETLLDQFIQARTLEIARLMSGRYWARFEEHYGDQMNKAGARMLGFQSVIHFGRPPKEMLQFIKDSFTTLEITASQAQIKALFTSSSRHAITRIEDFLEIFPEVVENEGLKDTMLYACRGDNLKGWSGRQLNDFLEKKVASSKIKNIKLVELIERRSPGIVKNHLDEALLAAAKHHNPTMIEWLFRNYKISDAQIKNVWNEQLGTLFFSDEQWDIIEKLLCEYPQITSDELIPVMETAAVKNIPRFEALLNKVPGLQPHHLQGIFNEAVRLCGLPKGFVERETPAKRVRDLILRKFPDMKPH